MSFNIDTAKVQQYRDEITVKFQQMDSRLRPYVRVESQRGEYQNFDRIGPTAMTEITTRHADTPLISTDHDRRQVGLRNFVWADMIDTEDKAEMLADPAGSYIQNALAAANQKMDDIMLEAAFGTARTDKTGSTNVVWSTWVATNTRHQVAVDYNKTGAGGNSNLTIDKLRRARYALDKAEAANPGQDDLTIICDPSQIESLLGTTEVGSKDYNSVAALVDGRISSFMGFRFIKSNRVLTSGSAAGTGGAEIRRVLAFERQGLLLTMGQELFVDVSRRADKNHNWQVFIKHGYGSVRLWEEKVVEVLCDEGV